MSIYLVAAQHVLHTCPAEQERHAVDTTRTVLQTIPGRSCLSPVTITCGRVTVTIPCGRHTPAEQQCGNCRTIVTHPIGGNL